MIPKRFIRIWLGDNPIPELFEQWWDEFKVIHPDWEFVTITSFDGFEISDEIKEILPTIDSYAGLSDILRLIVSSAVDVQKSASRMLYLSTLHGGEP